MRYPGTLPRMADKHTGAIWAGGAALIATGGIFMAVTGFEPTAKPRTIWANSWFDVGLALVILGLLITLVGVVFHFRKEAEPASAAPAVTLDESKQSLAPLTTPEPKRDTSPLRMTLVDEDWSLVEDTLWAFAIAVRVENTNDKTILVADSAFTDWDDGDRNTPLYERFRGIWPAVTREKTQLFAALNDEYSGIFEDQLLFSPNQPLVMWYIGEALPLQGGGRPRFTFTLNDSLGNSYDLDVDRRPAQRFRTK